MTSNYLTAPRLFTLSSISLTSPLVAEVAQASTIHQPCLGITLRLPSISVPVLIFGNKMTR